MIIVGIDPGVSTGAIVAYNAATDSVCFALAASRSKSDRDAAKQAVSAMPGSREFAAADLLAQAQATTMLTAVDDIVAQFDLPHRIAVEAFVDQRSRAREEKAQLLRDRWKTPLVIGHLSAGLAPRGFTVAAGTLVWQDAGIVQRHYATELAALRAGEFGEPFLPQNARLLSSEHRRDAWAHAAWCAQRYTPIEEDHS